MHISGIIATVTSEARSDQSDSSSCQFLSFIWVISTVLTLWNISYSWVPMISSDFCFWYPIIDHNMKEPPHTHTFMELTSSNALFNQFHSVPTLLLFFCCILWAKQNVIFNKTEWQSTEKQLERQSCKSSFEVQNKYEEKNTIKTSGIVTFSCSPTVFQMISAWIYLIRFFYLFFHLLVIFVLLGFSSMFL